MQRLILVLLMSLGITSLPAEIGLLTNLQELRIWDNQITALPPEIGQLPNLETLWVGGNSLDAASRALVQRLKARGVFLRS